MDCSTSGFPVLHQLPELAQTHVHWVGDAIQPSHPVLPPSPLPSIFSCIRVFSNESALHIRWPEYWIFSFSISPSNEYLGLISFRIWSPCSPSDSQESSPASQFKSINSSALSLLYGPTLCNLMDCSTPGFPVLYQLLEACSNSCPSSPWCHLWSVEPTTLTNYAWASKTHSRRCLGWGTFRYSRGACGLRKWCKLLVLKFYWSPA